MDDPAPDDIRAEAEQREYEPPSVEVIGTLAEDTLEFKVSGAADFPNFHTP